MDPENVFVETISTPGTLKNYVQQNSTESSNITIEIAKEEIQQNVHRQSNLKVESIEEFIGSNSHGDKMYSLEKEEIISEQEIMEEIVLPSETSPNNIPDKMKEVRIQDIRKDELSLEIEQNIQEELTLTLPTQWSREHLLGSGGYGKVYLCRDYRTSLLFAVKQVELGNMKEQISKGSLHQHIALNGSLTETLTSMYTKQILEGLVFLHANNIVHRDIKAANILRNTDGNIKLTDFGVSKQLQKISIATGLNTTIGSPYWMAPEIIKEKGYGQNVDLWSLGCTVVEMLTSNPPFYHLEPFAAIFQIGKCKHPEYTLPTDRSDSVKNFLLITFQMNSTKRTSAQSLLQHRFITDYLDEPLWKNISNFDRPFNIVLLGDRDVGKTSLHDRYIYGVFNLQSDPTHISSKLQMWGPYRFKVLIWHTSGHDTFDGVIKRFLKNASVAILLFDLTSSKTLDVLKTRLQPLLESVNKDCLKVLVGTKLDIENRQVTVEEGTNYAMEINKPVVLEKLSRDPYFETSSKTNKNVNEVFKFICKHCLKKKKTRTLKDFFFRV